MYKAGRTKARRVRAAHGIPPEGPLPDILALADAEVPVAIFENLAHVAGAYVCRDDHRLIVLNGSDPPVRLRFTLAHELCHHCFRDDAQPDTHAGLARPGHWIEVRANAFAAELLVPETDIQAWAADRDDVDLYDVVTLAARYGVSALMMLIRLVTAGAPVDEAAVRARIDANDHLGIAKYFDAVEDDLAEAARTLPRIPAAFDGSMLVRLALGELTIRQAAGKLRVTEQAIRDAYAPLGLIAPA